jgi:hypothetical protein
LIAGSIVLLASIVIGNGMGTRVLSAVVPQGEDLVPSPVASTTASPGQGGLEELQWKRQQIVSVATDPAFPDPRVTPPPTYVPTAPPTPRRTPTPKPTASGGDQNSHYTSPPLPIPIVSHEPGEESDPYGEPIESPSASPEVTEVPRPGETGTSSPAHSAMMATP